MTGAAWGFAMLVVVRFLFGAGEAGALPNAARVLREWFPDSSRGRAQGLVTAAMMLGGAAAPAGLAVADRPSSAGGGRSSSSRCAAWPGRSLLHLVPRQSGRASGDQRGRALVDRRGPQDPRAAVRPTMPSPAIPRAAHQAHGPIPWRQVFPSANIWLLSGVMMHLSSAIYELLVSWYPTYLQSARGAEPGLSSWLASMVLRPGACATFSGGWLIRLAGATDRQPAMGPDGPGRRRLGARRPRHPGQHLDRFDDDGLGLRRGGRLRGPVPAPVLVGLRHAGQRPAPRGALRPDEHVRLGWAGSLANTFVGGFADWRKGLGYTGRDQWDPALYVFVAIALVGMILWILVDPRKTVESDESGPAATEG